jgi:DNA-binding transcriptional regulator YiaG
MSKTLKTRSVSNKIVKSRRRYSNKQKIKILKQLEDSNLSVLAFSKKINIPVRTLQDWKQSKNKILGTQKKTLRKMELVINQC